MPASEKTSNPIFQKISFLLILVAISACFIFMVRSFVLTLLMAGVFTGLTHPLYRFLLKRFRKTPLASVSTLLVLLLILVLPAMAVIAMAYHEAMNFFSSVDFKNLPHIVENLISQIQTRFPALLSRLSPQDVSQFTAGALKQIIEFILKHGADWSVLVAGNVANIFLMLFMMFYLYMDGERILRKLIHWSPLRDDYEDVLLQKFISVSRATLKGILVVGLIQGTIGTILYLSLGIGSPVLLGVLMVFFSVIPVFGTGMIWVPVALYLFFQHRFGAGITVTLVGVLVISSVDNFLRPILVGKDIKMHDLMVLISTLGGLAMFGLPGFIMGPVIASLFLSIWTMFEEVFATELDQNRIQPLSKPSEL